MVGRMDRFWIARGLTERELVSIRWRGAAYAGLAGLAGLILFLAILTIGNLAG